MPVVESISDGTFENTIKESNNLVLVDFWAEWCGPCKMLTPVLDDLQKEIDGIAKIVKMDIDANSNAPTKLGVRAIPTLILFKKGEEIGRKTGFVDKESLKKWIEENK